MPRFRVHYTVGGYVVFDSARRARIALCRDRKSAELIALALNRLAMEA